jgi:mono/diheme cytochrome c family protein
MKSLKLFFAGSLIVLATVNSEAAAKKCAAGEFWDTSLKLFMPTAKTGDAATFGSLSKKVFSQQCTSCHMAMGPKDPAEAGIDLSSFAALTASNNSKTNPKHAPFIVAGDPEQSKLYIAVKTGKMPQKEDGTQGPVLSAADVQDIYDWIKQGALNN